MNRHDVLAANGSGVMNQAPDIDLSVIIVNWNAGAYLPAALDSLLRAQGNLTLEVWLIDNASGDGSVAQVRQRYPQVRIIPNTENRGFAAANNQGLAIARGRYLLLLNPDTEMAPAGLGLLLDYLEQHPDVGVAGPSLVGERGKVQGGAAGYDPSPSTIFNYATFLYRLLPDHFIGLWVPQSRYARPEPIEVDWVSGACMMVRRIAALAAGPLDERYFMYSEDVEWCRRIRRAGYRVVCCPAIKVVHHVGGSSRQREAAFHAHHIDSLDKDLRARYATPSVAAMHMMGAFGFLLRYLIYEACCCAGAILFLANCATCGVSACARA